MTFLLWLLGAGATSALSVACILAGSSGKLSWLALVPFVWTVALLAGAAKTSPISNWRALRSRVDGHA